VAVRSYGQFPVSTQVGPGLPLTPVQQVEPPPNTALHTAVHGQVAQVTAGWKAWQLPCMQTSSRAQRLLQPPQSSGLVSVFTQANKLPPIGHCVRPPLHPPPLAPHIPALHCSVPVHTEVPPEQAPQ
jgi:hypothetical protein